MDGKWFEVKVITKSEAIEPISGIFYGLDVKGVAIEDPEDINIKQKDKLSWDFADVNIFEFGADAAVVKGYFNENEKIDEIIKYIEEKIDLIKEMGIDVGRGIVTTSDVFEEDWATSWKKYYKPLRIGNKILIKPIWEDVEVKETDLVVELDPGMAFGTGTHETTSMCVELLEKYITESDRVFDIGTGSGILSIVSSKLGAKEVVGVDLDEVAVASAKENVAFNKISNVEVLHGDLVDVIEGKANIVVANIIAEVVVYLTSIIKPFIDKDGYFITSGIIRERKEDVLNALDKEGFKVIEITEKGEWVAIAAKPM
ncbi:50S ribosomal protein L11 methyltransferase [Clostridium cylindrosporum]|uniref:Ribosomal protein L11 methyltransferase n=1 Tax=Clostridium cylindrosporum DSM 605 TaxID=1121307 RepID=A0A0J8DBF5_CLOCY|nr:50S ribosomal protein L11 methyltransferase [Clostridium cylindrosporum]KMT21644.1 ribosomal protein L11 methyltransferase PrmA [Clostridium cylindrosporum DSM 605]